MLQFPDALPVTTFSIVAGDLVHAEWGVAVQSRAFAVGQRCPTARAGVGVITTQSLINPDYGPEGLALLTGGASAEDTVQVLTRADPGREVRQVAVVDAHGRSAAFTGAGCVPWAGHVTGPRFSAQGNMLAGPQVVAAMAQHFQTNVEQPLAERLLGCLEAGQQAGGDRRGQQSAVLIVVRARPNAGGRPYHDRTIDLRVDDSAAPIAELKRLLDRQRQLAGPEVPVEDVVLILQWALRAGGYYDGPVGGLLDHATELSILAFARARGYELSTASGSLRAPRGLLDAARQLLEDMTWTGRTAL